MNATDEMGFHPKWVKPFYLELLNCNFLRLTQDEQSSFAASVRQVLDEIDPVTLSTMLDHLNWRPRLTAGWLIGFAKLNAFAPQIGLKLLASPHYAHMYCFALARINNDVAVKYLQNYLRQYLIPSEAEDYLHGPTLSVDWGLVTLQYLDAKNGTAYAADFSQNGWRQFIEAGRQKFGWNTSLMEHWLQHWSLEKTTQACEQVMEFAQKHFD